MSTQPSIHDVPAWIASTERRVQGSIGVSSAGLKVSGDLPEGETVTIDVGALHQVTSRILQCRGSDAPAPEAYHRHPRSNWWLGAGAGWEFALIKLSVMLQGRDPTALSVEELHQELGALWVSAGS